ncbi:UDP-3-O-(3-hydroxymyristoyl)glucosamine N-acyltransferase [Nitrosophilus alvini]|uniref:UDP-3-O-(3-hydroxymyristoyl)glucosamine N-acyltransferase n=1 Tax=Nitrosophilus alvini TaxID=2714855 RepID=UPI00190B03C9|nr:UDP-3-O-(3-hydroxymyristoyl)glucosamine N-acyltransferase [Nitrosophilus alvini]
MLLSELAKSLELELVGEDREIRGIESLDKADSSQLSFLENPKYLKLLKDTKAAAVILNKKYLKELPENVSALISEEPYLSLAYATKFFAKPPFEKDGKEPEIEENVTIAPNVYIGKGAVIKKGVTLMPGVFVGDNVTIEKGTLIYPNVTVYRDCKIGKNCIIHAGAVIGSDGFGFAHKKDGTHVKIYQNGNVVIEDDVEIGANTTIDRAVFGSTVIKKGVKIDNLVQIGHNCEIGEYSIIVSQVGISGSTILGRNVVMGGQSATAGHLKIGDFATIAARGGVTKSIEGSKVYSGFPLMPHKEWLRLQAKLSKLLKE